MPTPENVPLIDLPGRLQSGDVVELRDALLGLAQSGRPAPECIPLLARLLEETRYVNIGNPGTPNYEPLSFLAINALVVLGALAEVRRAIDSTLVINTPVACYDQGMYIGDYYSQDLSLADHARAALTAAEASTTTRPPSS